MGSWLMSFRSFYFLTVSLPVYLSIFIGRKLGFFFPEVINSYLSDLLCMPILLILIRSLTRVLRGDRYFEFTGAQLVFMTLYVALIFEFLLPSFSRTYTSDLIDLLCYGFGTFCYGFFLSEKALGVFTPNS